MRGSSLWLGGISTLKAHMDGHCESTLTLQLAGRTDSFDIHSSYTLSRTFTYMRFDFSPGMCFCLLATCAGKSGGCPGHPASTMAALPR